MRLKPGRVAEFRSALEQVDTAAFGLVDVEIFPGSTVYSARSTVACRFDAAKPQTLRVAGAEAARLVGAKLGFEIAWGVHDEAGQPRRCGSNIFPAALTIQVRGSSFQALQAAFLGVAAAKGGKAAQQAAAERELARFDKTPFQPIFVQSGFLISAARRDNIPVHNVGGSNVAWQFGWGSRSEIFYMTASQARFRARSPDDVAQTDLQAAVCGNWASDARVAAGPAERRCPASGQGCRLAVRRQAGRSRFWRGRHGEYRQPRRIAGGRCDRPAAVAPNHRRGP